jgi:hypothetical protein
MISSNPLLVVVVVVVVVETPFYYELVSHFDGQYYLLLLLLLCLLSVACRPERRRTTLLCSLPTWLAKQRREAVSDTVSAGSIAVWQRERCHEHAVSYPYYCWRCYC